MKTTLGLTIALLISGVAAVAADVAGDWKLDGSIGQFPVDIVCSLKEDGTKITGVCKGNDIGEVPLKGEKDGNSIKWSYDVNFQGQQFTIVYSATLDSPSAMKGSITVAGNASGTFIGKKQ